MRQCDEISAATMQKDNIYSEKTLNEKQKIICINVSRWFDGNTHDTKSVFAAAADAVATVVGVSDRVSTKSKSKQLSHSIYSFIAIASVNIGIDSGRPFDSLKHFSCAGETWKTTNAWNWKWISGMRMRIWWSLRVQCQSVCGILQPKYAFVSDFAFAFMPTHCVCEFVWAKFYHVWLWMIHSQRERDLWMWHKRIRTPDSWYVFVIMTTKY